jgi:hypothetical protein
VFSDDATTETAGWAKWLAEKDNEKMILTLTPHACASHLAGSRSFVVVLESRLGRGLQARPVGRPGKRKLKLRWSLFLAQPSNPLFGQWH